MKKLNYMLSDFTLLLQLAFHPPFRFNQPLWADTAPLSLFPKRPYKGLKMFHRKT